MIRIPDRVLEDALTLQEIGLFCYVAQHVQRQGDQAPLSREEIARRTGMALRTIDKHLAHLRAERYLEAHLAPGGGTYSYSLPDFDEGNEPRGAFDAAT